MESMRGPFQRLFYSSMALIAVALCGFSTAQASDRRLLVVPKKDLRLEQAKVYPFGRYLVFGKVWRAPVPLATETDNSIQDPQVGVDAAGNVTVIWKERQSSNPNQWDLWFVRRTRSAWQAPVKITDADGLYGGDDIALAAEATGRVRIFWQQSIGERGLWMKTYQPDTGWSTRFKVDSSLDDLKLVSNEAGYILMLFTPSVGGTREFKRYVPGTGWSGRQDVLRPPDGGALKDIGIDAAGNALFLWTDDEGFCSMRYRITGSWDSPAFMPDTTDYGHILFSRMEVNPAGQMFATWLDVEGERAVACNMGSAWEKRALANAGIPINNANNHESLAVDADGNALLIWKDGVMTKSSYYRNGAGWQSDQTVYGLSNIYGPPVLAADGDGVFYLAAFTHNNSAGQPQLSFNRYVPSDGWQTIRHNELPHGTVVYDLSITGDDKGQATAAWVQRDGIHDLTYNVWATRFESFSPWLMWTR